MARVAFIVTTCHEFEGIKALSATLKQRGHATDCFITSEERDFHGAVLDWRPDVLGIYATIAAWRHAMPWLHEVREHLEANRDFLAGQLALHFPEIVCLAVAKRAEVDRARTA